MDSVGRSILWADRMVLPIATAHVSGGSEGARHEYGVPRCVSHTGDGQGAGWIRSGRWPRVRMSTGK